MIESAMKDLHFSVNPKRNNKQQALDVIKQLAGVSEPNKPVCKLNRPNSNNFSMHPLILDDFKLEIKVWQVWLE